MSLVLDVWFQDAVKYVLLEHVKKQVKMRDFLDDSVEVSIFDIKHDRGRICVSWVYQAHPRRPTSRKVGEEVFTLADLLNIFSHSQ